MMTRFSAVSLVLENCEDLVVRGRMVLRRLALLGSLGRFAGLDIYASATK
jgi:hypothetical protein